MLSFSLFTFFFKQELMRESPNDNSQSPEVTSKAEITEDEVKENVKSLTEKLSAALVNVSAKEDLVKQHAKVAEEAVAGNIIATSRLRFFNFFSSVIILLWYFILLYRCLT